MPAIRRTLRRSIAILAGPAGAANACNESMNPAASGNSSGLIVACTFDSTGTSSALSITDYDDAVWHYGAARNVQVTVQRTSSSETASRSGCLGDTAT